MKVPCSANNQNNQTVRSKPVNRTINTTPTSSPYEPKSVLELRGSPSPVADQKPAPVLEDSIQLEDLSHQFDDWDSFMTDWGLHDDSSPVSKPISQLSINSEPQTLTHYSSLQEFPPVSSFDSTQFVPSDFSLFSDISTYNSNIVNTFDVSNDVQSLNNNNWNLGFDYVDDLIRLAECFDTNSLQLGHVILARLNQPLRSPIGKPPQRAAFYFKEALQSLFTGFTQPTHPASSSEIIQTIKAQETFSSISPIPMFSSFAANQAVLEAVEGCTNVHIIDFDIGLGGQWASFMKELAGKVDSRKATPPPVLRVTAVVPEQYATESRLIIESLTQFARELNIRFDIEFVSIRSFGYLSFKAIKFMDGEKIAVVLSPAIFQQIGTVFLNDLRHVPTHVVVYVNSEGQMGFGTSSYRQTVIGGLEYYSILLESLEVANVNSGGDWMRKIENFVLFPKILKAVEAAGHQGPPWREALVAAGLRQVGPSQFSYLQAECLLRRMQVRGFHVANHQEEMLLYWNDRPLVATSAWKY
ncbi:Scarecrow-like protein 15 [Abeliophyllum distichum]|uniref:Scarecrow-like protein 15 n=1 Tax=Abeliophyllum distichum TaxID=126358 RepID=A0ABD1V2L9_9LAMI